MSLGERASNTLFLAISVVGLVIVALGFSGVVHKRIGISSRKKVTNEDIADNVLALEYLQKDLERIEAVYKRSTAVSTRMQQIKETTKLIVDSNKARLTRAKELEPILQAEIRLIERDFATYRDKVRENSWIAATGEKHPTITTLDGKTYHDVTVRTISANGIKISHKNGSSQIPADQLGQAWQERLHWSKKP